MLRRFWVGVTLTAVFGIGSLVEASQNRLIPVTTLNQRGLARAWASQVEVAPSKPKFHVAYYENVLYVQTDGAMVMAIDAETGKTIWAKQVGKAGYPSMAPSARGELLAVLNGPRLFVLNRANGDLLMEKDTKGAPGAGPALSARRVYIPMASGMMVVYRIESPSETAKALKANEKDGRTEAERQQSLKLNPEYVVPLCHQSSGRLLVQPVVTRDEKNVEYVAWPTDLGHLNFGRIDPTMPDAFTLKYRLTTSATITAPPAYLPPDPKRLGDGGVVFITSHDGFLYAVQEDDGGTRWRFSAGEPISQSPVAIEDRVYITTDTGRMYCINARTGQSIWRVEGATQFVAAGKSRIYATDQNDNLVVFNAADGVKLDAIPTGGATTGFMNIDTDRIFLIGESGLIQCLHESEQEQPIVLNKDRKDAAKAGLLAQKAEEEKPVKVPQPRATTEPSSTPAATPKTPPAPKEPKTPKTPKTPRKGGKGKVGGADAGGGLFGEGGGAAPKGGTKKKKT